MKRKISKRFVKLFMTIMIPLVSFLTLGIFLINNFVGGYVGADDDKFGALSVRKHSTLNIGSGTKISECKALNGGAFYVSENGELNIGDENSFIRYDEDDVLSPKGDYVYFGSYPQTYQPDISVITSRKDAYGYYYGTDGNKYAKVVSDSYGENYSFSDGTRVENGATYYFKVEPLKWRILKIENGNALLLCEKAIDQVQFNYSDSLHRLDDDTVIYSSNYKYSDVRAFLNGYAQDEIFIENGTYWGEERALSWENKGFLQKAFTFEERNHILTTVVDNSTESVADPSFPFVCENTNDKIFLLSYQELLSSESEYGLNLKKPKKATDLVKACDVHYYYCSSDDVCCATRSPGGEQEYRFVDDGCFGETPTGDDYGVAIAPSLVVSLDFFKTPIISGNTAVSGMGHEIYNEGSVNMRGGVVGGTVSQKTLIRYDENGNEDVNGDYVYFGSYPQTLFQDVELTSQMDESGYWQIGTDGNRYLGHIRVEPLKWKILEIENGEVLLVCDKIVDAYQFSGTEEEVIVDGETIYPSNYANSIVRNACLSHIYKRAFTAEEKNNILLTNVDNSLATTSPENEDEFCCETTREKLFLLSWADLTNSEYGFKSDPYEIDVARRKRVTDFVKVLGLECYEEDYAFWWLRSPYLEDCSIVKGGEISEVYPTEILGVVPAMKISAELLGFEVEDEEKTGSSVYNTGEFTLYNGTINGDIYNNYYFSIFGGTVNGDIYDDGGNLYIYSRYGEYVYDVVNDIYIAEKITINGDIHYSLGLMDYRKIDVATINGDIYVKDGAELYIYGTTINGNIIVEDGSKLIIGNSTIVNGNIVGNGVQSNICFKVDSSSESVVVNGDITTAGRAYICIATIFGDVIGFEISSISFQDVTVEGNITTEGEVYIYSNSFNCSGSVNLGKTGTITFENYDGFTPIYSIFVKEERVGVVATIKNYSGSTENLFGKIHCDEFYELYSYQSGDDIIISLRENFVRFNVVNFGLTGSDALRHDYSVYNSDGSFSEQRSVSFESSQNAYLREIRMRDGECIWILVMNYTNLKNFTFQQCDRSSVTFYYRYSVDLDRAKNIQVTIPTGFVNANRGKTAYILVNTVTMYYDVSFNANGGTFETQDDDWAYSADKTTATRYIDSGSTIDTPADPVQSGYAFDGWYDSATGGTKLDSSLVVKADKTYYAHWTLADYVVTFDLNATSASFENETDATKYVTSGSAVGTLPEPSRPNYNFVGWFKEKTGDDQITEETIVTADVTYYAHWKRNEIQITLNVNASDGKFGTISNDWILSEDNKTATKTVILGSAIGTLPTPTWEGTNYKYEFAGWYTDGTGGTQVSTTTTVTADVTYYAHWKKVYKISGDYVYFGWYPQTLSTYVEEDFKNARTDNNGYYLGLDGNWYAKVVADSHGENFTFSDGTLVKNGATYYFKVEPVKWKKITNFEDGSWLIYSDQIIEDHKFHSSEEYVEYGNSSIRTWLNETLYCNMFSNEQTKYISLKNITDISHSGTDSLFLLTHNYLVKNKTLFGFTGSETVETTSGKLLKLVTDYSIASGVYSYYNPSSNNKSGWWVLQDTEKNGTGFWVYYIDKDGKFSYNSIDGSYGVVPALVFNPKGTSTFTSNQKLNKSEDENELTTRTFSSLANVDPEVFFDDKKKYSTEVVLEEKRYTNDVVQLPKIGT